MDRFFLIINYTDFAIIQFDKRNPLLTENIRVANLDINDWGNGDQFFFILLIVVAVYFQRFYVDSVGQEIMGNISLFCHRYCHYNLFSIVGYVYNFALNNKIPNRRKSSRNFKRIRTKKVSLADRRPELIRRQLMERPPTT